MAALWTCAPCPPPGWWSGSFSPRGFRDLLAECCDQTQVVHTHGIWGPVVSIAAGVARKKRIPYIISPKGMLDPVSLRRRFWKKKLARLLYVDRAIEGAACFLTTADLEARHIREAGVDKPIAVIGYGLDTDVFCQHDRASAKAWLERIRPELRGQRLLMFLGRIHPQKGTQTLLDAWRWMHKDFPGWHVVLVGPDWRGHRRELQERAEEEGTSGQVTFLDGIVGDGKALLYAACDVFVLPSPSENYGVVIAEALASAKPVIATTGTPWQDLQRRSCGWWVEPDADSLAQAMRQAMLLSDEQRDTLGRCGRELALERCSWQSVTAKTNELYTWLIRGGAAPSFVDMD